MIWLALAIVMCIVLVMIGSTWWTRLTGGLLIIPAMTLFVALWMVG